MEQLFEKIKRSNHLPQLPQVMLNLVRLCDSDAADVDELIRIISTDPGLTAKLLQIIASPYVNLPRQVNTLKTAVVYLGLDTIRNIAVSSSAMHFFRMSRILPEFNLTRFWHHAYTCGVMARRIAREAGQANPEEFFLAGLLHDVGTLALMQIFPKAYAKVLADQASGMPKAQAESARFHVDASQVSAWLFNQWQLNPIASDAVVFLDSSLDKIRNELPHVKILYLADTLAENTVAKSDAPADMDQLAELAEVPGVRLSQLAAEAAEEVRETAGRLGICLSPSGSPGTDSSTDRSVARGIKDLSMFYGTLEALTAAKNEAMVLDAVQRGLEIIFRIPRMFFFLLDPEKGRLRGTCHPDDRIYPIVRTMVLPMAGTESLVVRSAGTNTCLSSFTAGKTARSDTRIIRLLDARGVYCVPITSRSGPLGVMALGASRAGAEDLDQHRRLLTLFSRQTGICLENIYFHQNYARDVSDKKMAAYTALTDRVIHEINNPVAIVKSYLEILKTKLPANHPAQGDLAVVGEEMVRISSLLTGLSRYAGPGAGGVKSVDLNRSCARVLKVLNNSLLLPRKIRVRTEFGKGIPIVRLDENGLKQILINLVKNAAEAMVKGGELYLSTRLVSRPETAMVNEKPSLPETVAIDVRDTGPGMPEAVRKRLFEPYFTTKKAARHSGLGLAIVQALVREMNGDITCQSQKGSGTRFSVCLPLIPPGETPADTGGDASETPKVGNAHG